MTLYIVWVRALKHNRYSTGHTMKQLQRFSIYLLLSAAIFTCGSHDSLAQSGPVIPIPIVTNFAGIPTGSTNKICANALPQSGGANYGDGCPANQAQLTTMYDVQVDNQGNVYTGEQSANFDLRMIYNGGAAAAAVIVGANPQIANLTPVPGDIYTIGGGLTSFTATKSVYYCGNIVGGIQALDKIGDGCPAALSFFKPKGMAIDSYGDIISVNTQGFNSVRVIYAGGPQMAKLITLENPTVTSPKIGYIYQIAGGGATGTEGDGGLAINAGFINPRYIALDSQSNIYVTDGTTNTGSGSAAYDNSGNNVREIFIATGLITTVAGETTCSTPPNVYSSTVGCPFGNTGDGGPATSALFHSPYAIFFDRYDNLFITDNYNGRVRVVYRGGTLYGISSPVVGYVYNYIGGGTVYGTDGVLANQMEFGTSTTAATINTGGIDRAGNVYVYDGVTHQIWRFDAVTGIGTIVAGGPTTAATAAQSGAFCAGTTGPVSTDNYGDGCPATQAYLAGLGTLSFDGSGNFYFATSDLEIEKFSYNNNFGSAPDGTAVTHPLAFKAITSTTLSGESFTLQGSITSEFSDAGGDTCTSTAALAAKAVCVFNVTFNPIHAGLRPGTVQLLSGGTPAVTETVDGTGVAADLAIDTGTSSTLGTNLTPSGVAADLLGNVYVADSAGSRVLVGSSKGTTLTPVITGLNSPAGVAVDNSGNIFVADSGHNRILETTSAGVTIATLGTSLSDPKGVAVDGLGYAIVADTGNNRIVRIAPNGGQLTLPFAGISPAFSAPTAVSLDGLGNIYVLDSGNQRIVEYNNSTGIVSQITLDSGVVPAAMAVDPAGDVYVANSAAGTVLVYAPSAVSGNILVSSLTSPVGIAVDADANLFIADTSKAGALELRRSLGNINFPLTNLNTTTTASITLTNVGNAALSFPTQPLYTITGSPANGSNLFSLASAATNGCALNTSYLPGTGCNFTASFTPVANINATAAAYFNTNATNTASADAVLTAVGKLLVPTTTTISITPPSVFYSQNATVTVAVAPTTTTTTPSGTFTLVIDGKTQIPVSIGSGSYSITLTLVVGQHTISATYSGDTTYASSSASTTVTVNPALTATSIKVVPVNNNGLITLLFTSVVSATTATGQSGTVTFYAGTTAISPAIAINSTNNYTANYTSTALSFTPNSLTAVYSGSLDGNFSPSTSPVFQTGGGDFAVGSSSPTFIIPQGGIATLAVTLAPLFGGTGTITGSCTGLPQYSVCRFDPDDINLSSSPVSVEVQVYTNVSSTLASNHSSSLHSSIFLACGIPFALGLLLRRRKRIVTLVILLTLSLATAVGVSGCGNGTPTLQTFSTLVTPAGTYPITITFTGSNGLSQTHTATATLTILVDSGPY